MNSAATFPALGTTAVVVVTGRSPVHRAREILEEELKGIDLACSRFRSDSELSRVNAAAGRRVHVSSLFIEALEAGLRAAQLTDGIVDPTVGCALRAIGYDRDFALIPDRPPRHAAGAVVPGWRTVRLDRNAGTVSLPAGAELDLGATAKALAADRASRQIAEQLGVGVLVSLGGDVSVSGKAPAGGWPVGIADDHRQSASIDKEAVSINAGGLATSSTTARRWAVRDGAMHHIVDPRLGSSAAAVWRTVSVAAGSCLDANIASTAAIIQGHEAPVWLHRLGLPSRLVSSEGRVMRLGLWPRHST